MQRSSPFASTRLDEIRRVHHAARRRAGADHGVDLVDEQDRARTLLEPGDDALQALLEIAAVLRAGDQRAHVERVDRALAQDVRNLAFDDEPREPFGERRLADTGLADEQRIVLAAAAKDLDGALDLERPPDQRIDLARLGLRIEVGREALERIRPRLPRSPSATDVSSASAFALPAPSARRAKRS